MKWNTRVGQSAKKIGCKLRAWVKEDKDREGGKIKIKCGDCESKLKVWYCQYGLEVNGVFAEWGEWEELWKKLQIHVLQNLVKKYRRMPDAQKV
jgi:hypothetical protein